MAKVQITTAKPTTVRRASVRPGQVFKLVNSDGSYGRKRYACIGSNGKFLSLNIDNGQLASTQKGDKRVVIIGTASLGAAKMLSSWDRRRTTRARVVSGQIFENSKGIKFYALGRLGHKNASLNMGKLFNGDYAVNGDNNAEVMVIGEAALNVTLAA